MLDFENGVLMLPAAVQKDYLNDNSPVYTEIALADETVRVLQTYLAGCWKDVETLFRSRSADRVTTQGIRNIVKQAAVDAGVRPYTIHGRGEPGDVTPPTLWHSVAYRMLNREEGTRELRTRGRSDWKGTRTIIPRIHGWSSSRARRAVQLSCCGKSALLVSFDSESHI